MLKRALKIIVLLLLLVFIAIQFIPRNFSNPPIVQAETIESSMQVPENVQKLLTRSCNDCHTNNTVYPWYSNIQPAAAFQKNHIDDGRRHLNFSVWNTYDLGKKRRKLGEVCEQVEGKEMPLPSYLWIHFDAALSADDIKTLCDWANAERAKLDAAETSADK